MATVSHRQIAFSLALIQLYRVQGPILCTGYHCRSDLLALYSCRHSLQNGPWMAQNGAVVLRECQKRCIPGLVAAWFLLHFDPVQAPPPPHGCSNRPQTFSSVFGSTIRFHWWSDGPKRSGGAPGIIFLGSKMLANRPKCPI